MKKLITYLKALWRRGLDSQRKEVGVISGEATIEHPFSTYSAPFGTCWQPSGKLHSVVRYAAMLVMLFTIGSGNVWGADVTDEITASNLAATGTTYTNFSGVSITSDAVYAGNSAKNGTNIQLRSKSSNSGIVSTTSGGTVKSVKITVSSGSNTVDVYGSNNAYTAATDLYGNNKGTKLGSVTSTGTITVTGSYAYVGIRSNSGAIYLSKVEITWSSGGSSCSTNPTVGSASNSSISVTGATVSCTGITKGDCDIDEWGFVYGTATEPTGNAQKVSSGKSTTNVPSFNKTLTGLDPNQKYYVRAYAKVGSSTLYGSETNFTTKTITASSSNTTYGTVSRSKMVITGSPKSGGQYASPAYTVTGSTPANATTVTQSGNTFTVTSTSTTNITVTINFEAIPTYTVTWVAGSNSSFNSQTGTAGTALTDPGTPSAASYCPGGKVFVGWTATPIVGEGSAPADLFTSVSGKSIPVGGTTYYAVFATQSDFTRVTSTSQLAAGKLIVVVDDYNSKVLTTTPGYDTAPTESSSKITPSSNMIWTLEANSTNWKLKTGSSYLGVANTSNGTAVSLTSTNSVWTIAASSSGTNNFYLKNTNGTNYCLEYNSSSSVWCGYGNKNYATSTYFTERLYVATRTNYATTCCTDPGLNYGTGSVTKTFGNGTFKNTLTNSHSVSVTYESSNTDVATVASDGTVTIQGAGNATITARFAGNSTYCADEASYTLTVNKASISPTLSYDPAAVTVGSTLTSFTLSGNSGSGSVSYSSSNDAIATVNSSGVVTGVAPGTVTITATIAATTNYNGNTATSNTITVNAAACTGVNSLHTGNKDQGGWVTNQCFVDADWGAVDDAIYVGAFPLTNECYVGYAGAGSYYGTNWAVGGIKTYDIPEGRTLGWNSSNYYESYPGGALGTFHIYKNSTDENYYLRFKPSSYILRTGSDGTSWTSREMTVSATNSHYYETAELDLTSTLISEHAYVDLKTSGGDGHVWCNFSNDRTASGNVKVKSSVGDADGNFRGDNLKASDNGTHGKFRIDITKDVDNWKLAFVPMYRITYAANGGGSSMEPSAYAEISTTIAAAANGFTAPTGKQFNGWSDGVNTYDAGDNVTMNSNVTLTAQWADIDYTVTVNQSPSVGAETTGQTTTAHYNNTINITTTVPDGYIFSGWTSSPSVTFADASATNTSFSMPAGNVTVTANFTRADTYIDNIWSIVTAPKTGTYTRPTLSDQTPGGLTDCQHLHYHFVGWITKTKYDAGTTIDARTAPTGDIVPTGSVTANGSTYYAVWEKASAGGVSSYTELTDVSELAAGDHIIITDGVDAGMKAYDGSSNNCKEAAITISAGTITSIGDACELTLGGSSGHWTFFDGTYYIYAAGTAPSKSNYMKGKTTSDNACEWTITISGGETSVVSVTNTNTPHMQYNSNNSLFSCYNTESQYPVVLFRKPGVAFIDPIASCGEEYTITINKNNASAACSSCGAKVTENATTLSNLVAPTWSGHQVDYYMIASADNSTKIAEADGTLAKSVASWTDGDGKWIKGSDATIYAKWKYAEYEIAYYDQGGSAFSGVHGADHPTTHTYNTATTLVNPTKNGYNFAGWYTSSDCSTGLVTTLGATAYTSGPINLYAKWTLKTYTVTWVVNGSTIATQTSVTYGTAYEDLSSTPSDPADNALSSCGSDRFVGWVTAEYTAEGGTKVAQYDPYAVTNSTVIDDTHHTFYAMFAKESGTAFSLSVTSGDFKISGLVGGVNYYATGALSGGKYAVTTTANSGDDFTFTKVSDGVYTIKHKRSNKFVTWSSSTNFGEADASINWTISSASHGSWSVVPATATTRAFIMWYSSTNPESNSVFKPYATSNVTGTPDQYYYVEIGTSNLINYRTGCCSEKITLTVSDATSGAGGTVAMKWNTVSKSSGDQVSTCSEGTLNVEVTANPSYTLTAITIAGTNKTITLDPSDLTTGLPSTSKMTYTVTVPALATGTLTITPTFTRTYSVTYNLDGGETAGNTDVANYQSGATVTLVTPSPEKSGYNFAGWDIRDASSNVVTETSGHFTMPASNVTVTATWTAKPLTSISVTPATATVYVGQYVELPVTYDPADILTKGYTLVSTPSWCVTTGSTNTTLKITGGRGGATITEDKVETVSIKASADNTKTASVTVTVKPLPVDHFVDLIHGEVFDDHAATIVDNNLSTAYSAPGHADVDAPLVGNDCEKQNLHLVGWIESEWANTHLTATMSEFIAAEDDEHNPLFFATYAPMNVSGKTYYAVWAKEKE